MKQIFVKELMKLAEKDKDLVLLTGDLGFGMFDEFRKKYPKQFINMGIAEQNMIGVAAGLSMTGKKVIVYSIIPFVTFRCLEQIKNDLCYPKLNVKIVGAGAGYMYSTSGSSHHAIEDIGIMYSLPNMKIYSPGTEYEVEECTKNLFADKSPTYMRLGKLIKEDIKRNKFVFGRGSWFNDYNNSDVTIITTGSILPVVLEAMRELNRKGIKCRVINFHVLSPIDVRDLLKVVHDSNLLITVEDHNVKNGLGTIVADMLCQHTSLPFKLKKIGIPNMFVHEVGSIEHIRKTLGLTSNDIVERIINEKNIICM